MSPRCGKCNGCKNHGDGYVCDKCKFCLDSIRLGGPAKMRQACVFKWCVQKGKDVERMGLGEARPGRRHCPHGGQEVIYLQSHIKRKHLEHYKKVKGGLKRKQKIRTTCFECDLSMNEV